VTKNGIVTYGETVLSRTEKRSCHVRRNGRVTCCICCII